MRVRYALVGLDLRAFSSCNILVWRFVLTSTCSCSRRHKKNVPRLSPAGRLVLNLAVADTLVGLGLIYFSMPKFWPQVATLLAR